MVGNDNRFRFRFSVLGRYNHRMKGNEPAVTVNVLSGHGEHLVYAGTLTMSEPEWDAFLGALRYSLGDNVEIDDVAA